MSSGEDRSTCTPCRGTGRVVSTLGGDAHEVTCPWCGGSGRFQAGRDAQQAGSAEEAPQAERAKETPRADQAEAQQP